MVWISIDAHMYHMLNYVAILGRGGLDGYF